MAYVKNHLRVVNHTKPWQPKGFPTPSPKRVFSFHLNIYATYWADVGKQVITVPRFFVLGMPDHSLHRRGVGNMNVIYVPVVVQSSLLSYVDIGSHARSVYRFFIRAHDKSTFIKELDESEDSLLMESGRAAYESRSMAS